MTYKSSKVPFPLAFSAEEIVCLFYLISGILRTQLAAD